MTVGLPIQRQPSHRVLTRQLTRANKRDNLHKCSRPGRERPIGIRTKRLDVKTDCVAFLSLLEIEEGGTKDTFHCGSRVLQSRSETKEATDPLLLLSGGSKGAPFAPDKIDIAANTGAEVHLLSIHFQLKIREFFLS